MKTLWCSFMLILLTVPVIKCQTYVQGNQSGEWTKNKSPYVLIADITVPTADTLNIDPGVVIEFSKGVNLKISGTIIAEGIQGDSIRFTSAEPNVSPGDWGGIIFNWQTVNTISLFDYVIVEYGGGNNYPTGVIEAAGAVGVNYDIRINHSLIQYNSVGLDIGSNQNEIALKNSLIRNNTSNGLNGENITVSNVQFIDNSGYYSGNMGGRITFDSCTFEGNNPSAFQSTSSGNTSYFRDCTIINNAAGIASTYNDDTLYVDSCRISDNNGFGINGNNLYGDGTLLIYNSIITNNKGDGITNASQESIMQENDIIGNSGGITNISGDTSMIIRNNIIMNNASNGISLQKGLTPYIRFNDIYNNINDFSGLSAYYGDTTLTVNRNGIPSDLYMNIRRDPLFVSLPEANFHLTKNSPCINAGDTLLKDPDGSISDIGTYTTSTVPMYEAAISLSNKELSFGNVGIGNAKDTDLVIYSNGSDTLKIFRITSTDKSFFSKTDSVNVIPGHSFVDTLSFKPISRGNFTGQLIITSNAVSSPDTVELSGTGEQATGVKELINSSPNTYWLSQNYPNPFNPSTTIQYSLPSPSKVEGSGVRLVTLKIYNLLGQEVATLVNKQQQPGIYNVQFNIQPPTTNHQLASGVYFYKLTAGSFSDVKKLLLLK